MIGTLILHVFFPILRAHTLGLGSLGSPSLHIIKGFPNLHCAESFQFVLLLQRTLPLIFQNETTKGQKSHTKTATTKYSISTAFLLFEALFHFWVSSYNHEAPGQRTLEYSEEATFLEAGWHLWGALLILGAPATGRLASYSHVVDAVRSEGVICLVS